ncbi:MAG: 50S ribosomal protein L23 [Planctomycetes bacterium]|nr:50S ribosomal protein L23 [Planctomycetota bacterium]
MTTLEKSYQLIQRPLVTEKATDDTGKRNAYAFRVPRSANKIEIRQAVQHLFNVKVKSVNTLTVKSKWKIRGRSIGRTQEWKKAMVVLQEGQTIDVL